VTTVKKFAKAVSPFTDHALNRALTAEDTLRVDPLGYQTATRVKLLFGNVLTRYVLPALQDLKSGERPGAVSLFDNLIARVTEYSKDSRRTKPTMTADLAYKLKNKTFCTANGRFETEDELLIQYAAQLDCLYEWIYHDMYKFPNEHQTPDTWEEITEMFIVMFSEVLGHFNWRKLLFQKEPSSGARRSWFQ